MVVVKGDSSCSNSSSGGISGSDTSSSSSSSSITVNTKKVDVSFLLKSLNSLIDRLVGVGFF